MSGNIIVVNQADIASILKDDNPSENRLSADYSELNEFHFSSLWSIILEVPYSESYESKIKVITSDDNEVWIVDIPDELTNLIASTTPAEQPDITKVWASTDEFKWGWSEENVGSLLKDLVSLSKEALSSNQSLIYWGAL